MQQFAVCPDPVFVIGSPRSGTSALAWALHHHPDFWTSREAEFVQAIFGHGEAAQAFEESTLREETWIRFNEVSRSEFMAYLGLGVNALLTSRSEGKRWIEQSPSSTLFADDLSELFPGARFLHIVRDGRAVVNSMTHFADGVGQPLRDAGQLPRWAIGFREACDTWVEFVRAALHFGEADPVRCLLVRNEEMCSDPRAEFRRVHAFLGASDHPGPANFFSSSRINSSFVPLRWGDPEQPAPAPARAPSSADETWESWSPDKRALFEEKAAELMRELGYATSSGVAS